MAWFGRRGAREDAAPGDDADLGTPTTTAARELDEDTLTPVVERIGDAERQRIAAALETLAAQGIDVDDLGSLGAGLDAAYQSWDAAPDDAKPDHSAVVELYALGIGAHLDRHTDLDWQVVTDVFGTDLALTEGLKGTFVVVPHNLVAGRWMRGETGWLPGVVGHMVRRRTRR